MLLFIGSFIDPLETLTEKKGDFCGQEGICFSLGHISDLKQELLTLHCVIDDLLYFFVDIVFKLFADEHEMAISPMNEVFWSIKAFSVHFV